MSRKLIYVKPIAIEIQTDNKRYMAGGGGYVVNKNIIPYNTKKLSNDERKQTSKKRALVK